MTHELIVRFRSAKRGLLYRGPSHVKATLSDELLVEEHRIVLRFERSRKMAPETALSSPNSYVRYQLQRALLFYLACTGSIPPVHQVSFENQDGVHVLAHSGFTRTWKNCRVEHIISPNELKGLFTNQAYSRAMGLALSFWVKAQLVLFPSDRFHAAWSGFNALYAYSARENDNTEEKRIATFMDRICLDAFPESAAFVNQLVKTGYFEKIDWYNYVKSRIKSTKKAEYALQTYTDPEVMRRLCSGFQRHVDETGGKALAKRYSGQMAKTQQNPIGQLRFLLAEYCYSRRNRSFHGERAYPVFIIAPEAESRDDEILSTLLLHVIRESIQSFSHEEQIT